MATPRHPPPPPALPPPTHPPTPHPRAYTGSLRSGCPSQALGSPEEEASVSPGETLVPSVLCVCVHVRAGVGECVTAFERLCECVSLGMGAYVLCQCYEIC